MYMLNLRMKVCLQKNSACIFSKTVFHNQKMPKIGCDWSNTDFKIQGKQIYQLEAYMSLYQRSCQEDCNANLSVCEILLYSRTWDIHWSKIIESLYHNVASCQIHFIVHSLFTKTQF
jgi:hypothetical protein